MKKVLIILICSLFILSSCSNPEDTKKIEELEKKVSELEKESSLSILEKKSLCLEKSFIFKKNFTETQLNGLGDISYSPVLNSCIAEFYYYGMEEFENNTDNYNNKYIYDYLADKYIGRIAYYENFGFEDPGYLPEECELNYTELNINEKTKHITSHGTNNKEIFQKIQNTEYQYNNCLNYLKGHNNQIKVSLYNYTLGTFDQYDDTINTPIIFK